ncbi:S41 family peptidase [Riemerella anatipestifer]|nr:S41 family peptidase [Riemerella anatipestifer]MBT0552411.1 peptidase S41 [Riemerella anatipestifer]MBT0554716.1 peptidase S41 [Riemerella anatipestifer]MCE3025190.1 S41 family peptidase [Riemerella anatipestifer]MCU7542093.1 S41 family peptidase [Riemerella anatipestifer]MCU7560804.1 S41 family peptidase [Riemerella anatipestifer]
MKKLILLFLILIFGNLVHAQEKLTRIEKLATTSKVWGFLKYYHPQVAKGNYNWDEQLFEILPKIEKATTKNDLSKIYLDWISSLGSIEECKKCNRKSTNLYFNKNFSLSWIDNNKFFTYELSEKLEFIENNRHQGESYYVKYENKKNGNLNFTNELIYSGLDWNNQNLRLLTLFRYWNIIEYFFPYKYQIDANWDDVLIEMIPKFINPNSENEFHLAMLELVVSIGDSHAGFVSDETKKYFGHYWIPADFKLINGNAVITKFYNDSLAKADDLKIGDVITKVNNQEVEKIFKQNKKYISGSNLARKRKNAYYTIFNGSSDSVNVEFIRDDKTYNKTIKRYKFKEFGYEREKEIEKFKILNGNIGYVNMGILEKKDVSEAMEKLKNTKAIVFDIRNYPKGTGYAIAEYISSKRNDFYRVIIPDLDYPGKFVWRDGTKCGKNGELKYKGKVVLLVNETSQSHAEFTAMILQTGDNVATIGSQTSGADGNVDTFELVGGYETMITGIGIFYPDGTETQRKGVKVDIEVKPTIQGIIDGKDEVLEKAIEYVNR